jgi:hypothetical protein
MLGNCWKKSSPAHREVSPEGVYWRYPEGGPRLCEGYTEGVPRGVQRVYRAPPSAPPARTAAGEKSARQGSHSPGMLAAVCYRMACLLSLVVSDRWADRSHRLSLERVCSRAEAGRVAELD